MAQKYIKMVHRKHSNVIDNTFSERKKFNRFFPYDLTLKIEVC